MRIINANSLNAASDFIFLSEFEIKGKVGGVQILLERPLGGQRS